MKHKVEHRRVNFPDGTGFDEFRVPVLGRWSPTVRIWADGVRLSTGLIKTTEQASALVDCLQSSIDWTRGEKAPELRAVPSRFDCYPKDANGVPYDRGCPANDADIKEDWAKLMESAPKGVQP